MKDTVVTQERRVITQSDREESRGGRRERERENREMQSLCEMLSEVLTPECKLLTRTFKYFCCCATCACYVNNMLILRAT